MEKCHSTALKSPVQRVCPFGPDTEDIVGGAHYLVTVSKLLPTLESNDRFFEPDHVHFLLFYYFKQNADIFSLPNCKTRAMSLKGQSKGQHIYVPRAFLDFSHVESAFK